MNCEDALKENELYAATKGIRMYYQFNVELLRYEFLFEKYGYYTKIKIPYVQDLENFVLSLRQCINEASELLEACKSNNS